MYSSRLLTSPTELGRPSLSEYSLNSRKSRSVISIAVDIFDYCQDERLAGVLRHFKYILVCVMIKTKKSR